MQKESKFLFLLIGITALLSFSACQQVVEPIGDIPPISFNHEVMPIIASSCTASGCHGSEYTQAFTLLSYQDVISRVGVVAKDPKHSGLYNIVTKFGWGVMPPPPNPALTDKQVTLIYVWILQGAKNN